MIPEIANVLKPLRKRRNIVIFFSALHIVVGLLPPILVGRLIDHLYPEFTGASAHVFLITTIVFLLLFSFFLDWLQSFLREDLINRGAGMTRSTFFWNVLHKDYTFFLEHPVGDINNKVIHDAYTYIKTRLMIMPTLFLNVAHVLILFWFLFRLSFIMSFAVLLLMLIFMIFYTGVNKKLRHHTIKEREGFSELMSEANTTLTGVDTIQLYAGEDYAAEYFEKVVDHYEEKLTALKFWQTLAKASINVMTNLVPVLVIVAGVTYLIMGNDITIGNVVAFYYFLPRLKEPMKTIGEFNIDMQNARAVEDRVKELCIDEVDETLELAHVSFIEKMTFDDLGFMYPDGGVILDGINLSLTRGDALAITGPSGAGKTTLLRLLKRQITPTAGELLINGMDYTNIDPASYVARIAVLPQDVFLFDTTLYENISFGKGYSEKHVRDVAKLAGIDHFSMDEDATGLSGGEKQRIGLARALACEYDVLILDEPTSELDLETEQVIINNLKKVQQQNNCIIIAVTHSPKVVQELCNKTLVLSKN